MDGKNAHQFVSTNQPASSLILDSEKRRLYWIEKNPDLSKIMSVDLNGNDQKEIIRFNGSHDPVGLTLFKNYIIWSDNKTS